MNAVLRGFFWVLLFVNLGGFALNAVGFIGRISEGSALAALAMLGAAINAACLWLFIQFLRGR